MKCKRCGNTVLPNQVFCNKCGAPVTDEDNKKSLFDDDDGTKKGKNTKFIIIISVIMALIIILLAVLLIFRGKNKNQSDNTTTVIEESDGYISVLGNYSFTIPNEYSQGVSNDRLNIYDENEDFMGALYIQNTTYSKVIANRKQLIENKIKNTANATYSIESQEQKNINGVNAYVYKIKVTLSSNGEKKSGYYYNAISELDEDNTLYTASYITEDEDTTYKYLEKLINVGKTAEKRTVNTTTNDKNTVNTTKSSVNTTNTTVNKNN